MIDLLFVYTKVGCMRQQDLSRSVFGLAETINPSCKSGSSGMRTTEMHDSGDDVFSSDTIYLEVLEDGKQVA
jgi:hypothetical protein